MTALHGVGQSARQLSNAEQQIHDDTTAERMEWLYTHGDEIVTHTSERSPSTILNAKRYQKSE